MRKPLHVCIASDGALADAPKEMFAYIKGKVLIASRYYVTNYLIYILSQATLYFLVCNNILKQASHVR